MCRGHNRVHDAQNLKPGYSLHVNHRRLGVPAQIHGACLRASSKGANSRSKGWFSACSHDPPINFIKANGECPQDHLELDKRRVGSEHVGAHGMFRRWEKCCKILQNVFTIRHPPFFEVQARRRQSLRVVPSCGGSKPLRFVVQVETYFSVHDTETGCAIGRLGVIR